MGNLFSGPTEPTEPNGHFTTEQKNKMIQGRIKFLMSKGEEEEDNISDTLKGISELKSKTESSSLKKPLPLLEDPLLGGFDVETKFNSKKHDIGKKRYTKYDLFNILKNLDLETEEEGENKNKNKNKNMKKYGGNPDDSKKSDDLSSSLNDAESMEHIKNLILEELNSLKNKSSKQLGGADCGCGKSSKQLGGADCGCGKSTKSSRKLSSKLNLNNLVVEDSDKDMGQVGGEEDSSSDSDSDSESESKSDSKSSSPESNSNTETNADSDTNNEGKISSTESKFIIDNTTDTIEAGKHDSSSSSSSSSDSSSSSSSELGKKKSKKSKKSKKVNYEAGKKSKKSKKVKGKGKGKNGNRDENENENENTSNGDYESEQEGLSIFPFNSSDVKSSLSVKNYRMLRRKI